MPSLDITFHKKFQKSLKFQSEKIQKNFFQTMEIFYEDEFHYSLNNHALKGKLQNLRSINITSDVRVHYAKNTEKIVLMKIGTHAQLYK